MVTIRSNTPVQEHEAIADRICTIMHDVPSITPRPKSQIVALLRANSIALAFDNLQLVGWLVAFPYSAKVQELGMAYISPEYRNKGLLSPMIGELIERRPMSLAVTYETRLAELLTERWGFVYASLSQLVKLSHGRFITGRFTSVKTIRAVLSHTSKTKPIYLIKGIDR